MLFVSSILRARPENSATPYLFQSRNRDAFRFKLHVVLQMTHGTEQGFNLGIEILFISSPSLLTACYMFQSRNRDAFRFKSLFADC